MSALDCLHDHVDAAAGSGGWGAPISFDQPCHGGAGVTYRISSEVAV